jgi:hypothetical protein
MTPRHAHQTDLQLRALDLLRHAAVHGDATPSNSPTSPTAASPTKTRPQLYGTPYHDPGDGRGLRLWPVADLDTRRTEAGLGPHADYDATILHDDARMIAPAGPGKATVLSRTCDGPELAEKRLCCRRNAGGAHDPPSL